MAGLGRRIRSRWNSGNRVENRVEVVKGLAGDEQLIVSGKDLPVGECGQRASASDAVRLGVRRERYVFRRMPPLYM